MKSKRAAKIARPSEADADVEQPRQSAA